MTNSTENAASMQEMTAPQSLNTLAPNTGLANSQVSESIDEPLPFEQLQPSQFDASGSLRSEAEVAQAQEKIRSTKLELSDEQREILRKKSPQIYEALMSAEKQTAPLGKAEYLSHPLRPRTDAFPEDVSEEHQALVTQQFIRDKGERLLVMDMSHPGNRAWFETLTNAMAKINNEDFGLDALNREGSRWVQALEVDKKKIYAKSYALPPAKPGVLRGQHAVAYAASLTGAGRPASVPLMSSGWTAHFRAATNAGWAQFYEQVMDARTQLGRSTAGVGFSASNALYIEAALNFAAEHLEGCSFVLPSGMEDRSQILKYLSVWDIDTFLVGFLVACHPDGYALRMPCVNVGHCAHEQSLDAQLRTMLVYDFNAFSEKDLYHMLRSDVGSNSFESVLAYQANLRTNQSRIREIKKSSFHEGDAISIEFQGGSAYDYLASAKRYISRVQLNIETLMKESTSQQRRNAIINSHYWVEPLRDYAHLVKRVLIGQAEITEDPSAKENPRADIEDYLSRASESETMRKNFRAEAIKYQNESITSLLAMPGFDCPACGQPHNFSENSRFMNCSPVNVPQVFFSRALLRFTDLVK